ncbi:MAG TPA: TetR/AcrR family transcriptional regulator, partial [Saprospiraceae bacterium]|nr:TetR/AcrR family transcriptional regulator [Saprospiraceae bacterium]
MNNKEKILQTALSLFAEQGYDRTPTSQIAREAGVSEGLIFRHFGNKAGLLTAIIGQGLALIAESMQPYGHTGVGPKEAIAQHIERSFRLMRSHESFWRLAHKVRFQSAVQDVAAAQLEEVNAFILGNLTDNFEKAGAPRPDLEALLL